MDTTAAFSTLHECLVTTATLLGPFTPFIAEELWSNLAAGRAGRPDSVHLADYPAVHETAVDPGLDDAMAVARQVVELGRRVRTETKTRTRQPLAAAIVHLPERGAPIDAVRDLVAEELNVRRVDLVTSTDVLGRWRAKPDFKVLGPRLGSRVREVAAALEADEGAIAGRLAEGRRSTSRCRTGPPSRSPPGMCTWATTHGRDWASLRTPGSRWHSTSRSRPS